jgi:hypothetical protein
VARLVDEKCVQNLFGQSDGIIWKTDVEGRTSLIFKIDLEETGWDVVDYIHLAKNRNYWWTPVKPVHLNIFEISDSHASVYEDDSIL